jgi:hypothetical protein
LLLPQVDDDELKTGKRKYEDDNKIDNRNSRLYKASYVCMGQRPTTLMGGLVAFLPLERAPESGMQLVKGSYNGWRLLGGFIRGRS